jgi:hypothetical protein
MLLLNGSKADVQQLRADLHQHLKGVTKSETLATFSSKSGEEVYSKLLPLVVSVGFRYETSDDPTKPVKDFNVKGSTTYHLNVRAYFHPNRKYLRDLKGTDANLDAINDQWAKLTASNSIELANVGTFQLETAKTVEKTTANFLVFSEFVQESKTPLIKRLTNYWLKMQEYAYLQLCPNLPKPY